MLPGPAVPGCSLVSFHFLWAILCPQAVLCFDPETATERAQGLLPRITVTFHSNLKERELGLCTILQISEYLQYLALAVN